jgi:hypothetical protein
MRPYLKDGQLHLVLTKPERKKLNDALGICNVIAKLKPISTKLADAASAVLSNMEVVIDNTGWEADDPSPPENNLPI